MADNFGTVVVLTPKPNALPNTVQGGQHVTLLYFGDQQLSPRAFDSLVRSVEKSVKSLNESVALETRGTTYFGEDKDAHVVLFDDSIESTAVYLRNLFIENLPIGLKKVFEKADIYPTYRPHMTLGYLSKGYTPANVEVPDILEMYAVEVWSGETRVSVYLNDEALAHYGTPRHSGRYPWGSGENPHQNNLNFIGYVRDLEKSGMSQVEIAKAIGMTTTQLRAKKSIAKNEIKKDQQYQAMKLAEKGMSNVAIGQRMGLGESTVRSLLKPQALEKATKLDSTVSVLKENINENQYLDVGKGVSHRMGISSTVLNNAVAVLNEQGYSTHKIKVQQLGTGEMTTLKIVAPADVPYREIVTNQDRIKAIGVYSEDFGRTFLGIKPPSNVKSDRIMVRYAEDGGTEKDGVIELRPGVEDLSLGNDTYAQVRIAVDGTHYLKGMAVYADTMPKGVDIIFNTNKTSTGNKLDAMKAQKEDSDNPFGSVVRQKTYVDKSGKEQLSALNLVNEVADWETWSKSISSQILSKQPTALAKQQLGLKLDQKREEYNEIMSLTNPAVRKRLLDAFADDADSSAVHLKAAGLPRLKHHVILPVTSMKDTEVYAPNYKNGETVVLIRHPHGGTFEIPQLKVNNRQQDAKKLLGNAPNAIGINPRVASQLSGADFDGDTVLVIPNNDGKIKVSRPLDGLKDFDPIATYKNPPGVKAITSDYKQKLMGDASNLITDMTIKGANQAEIARAVRYSMVVIDAEKHNLDVKRAKIDNGISQLKKEYQNGPTNGAATLISRSKSPLRVDERKPRPVSEGGPIDPVTGEKRFVKTGVTYVNKKGETVVRSETSTRMAETNDARTLSSGTPMEEIYANHANSLKALANQARKASLETKPITYSPSANKAYAPEVASLKSALQDAFKNAPLERQAQLVANGQVRLKTQANPDMDKAELKKIKGQALEEARARVGAKKNQIVPTQAEWNAIQAGAVSNNMLNDILANANLDAIKELATPRDLPVMTTAKTARAQAMLNAGYTQSEVAEALGVSVSVISKAVS